MNNFGYCIVLCLVLLLGWFGTVSAQDSTGKSGGGSSVFKQFTHAITQANYAGNDSSAYAIYSTVVKKEDYSVPRKNQMRQTLIQHLSGFSQDTINRYIAGEEAYPSEFKTAAHYLSLCLKMMGNDAPNQMVADQYFLKGYFLFKDQLFNPDYTEAKESLRKALDLAPESVYIYSALGAIFAYENDEGKALESFKKAVEIDPTYAEGYEDLAFGYVEMEQVTKAEENFLKAHQLAPVQNSLADYAEELISEAWNRLRDLKKNTGAAEKWLLCAYRFDEQNIQTLYNLAQFYYLTENLEQAHHYADKLADQQLNSYEQIALFKLKTRIAIDENKHAGIKGYFEKLTAINAEEDHMLDMLAHHALGNKKARDAAREKLPQWHVAPYAEYDRVYSKKALETILTLAGYITR